MYTLQREKIGCLSFFEVSLRSAPVDDVSGVVFMIEYLEQLRLGVAERVDDQPRALSAALSAKRKGNFSFITEIDMHGF